MSGSQTEEQELAVAQFRARINWARSPGCAQCHALERVRDAYVVLMAAISEELPSSTPTLKRVVRMIEESAQWTWIAFDQQAGRHEVTIPERAPETVPDDALSVGGPQ